MLVSHLKRFIYLKTVKTAGTSVEIFLERYCRPEGTGAEHHATAEVISPAGIVGYRGPNPAGSRFFNHMPAAQLRSELGAALWDSCFRFCVIRNPFDKAVSYWWFRLPDAERQQLQACDFSGVRSRFNADLASGALKLPIDRHIYRIGDETAVHAFIRYERLQEDLASVCRQLGIDRDVTELGQYKSGYRGRPERFAEYFDARSRALVQQAYAWELDHFGYEPA